MHSFGDAVIYVKDGTEINALVAQSQPAADGEHLTLIFLDPALSSPIMGGSQVAKAISTVFATPLKPGTSYGWKDAAKPVAVPTAADIGAVAAEQKAKEEAALDPSTASEAGAEPNPSPEASSETPSASTES